MKRILVPTDFSPVADNAMLYAVALAAKFGSELILYHVYSFDRFNYDLNYSENDQPYTQKMEQKMKLTKLRIKDRILKYGLSVKTFVEKSSVLSLFQSEASALGVDMIVMGTKGASGLKKTVFGSVAAEALEVANVPVLAIPPAYSIQSIDHIILATDNKANSADILAPLQKLAHGYGAKVTALNVKTDQKDGSRSDIHRIHLEGVEVSYQETPLSNSINETINKYVLRADCDLLCMIKREKGFFESIFKKSIAKEQVYNSHVPLLVLPGK
jgi:nucleotide-binding universal stress UspA family protein